jgi:hypothetical protein
MSTRAGAAALALALLVGGPARAADGDDDDDVTIRRMGFVERGASLLVSVGFAELFDPAALEGVASGLPTTVVVRLYVYRARDEPPLAVSVLRFDVVYDLWDEAYVVRASGPLGATRTRYPDRARAIAAVTALAGVPIVRLANLPPGVHHFAALVAELNPLSDELRAEMRRWLTRRAGDRIDSSSSFFGTFVSVFVNPRLDAAQRVVRLRSQPFYRVAR